jgi:hypothetical protein
MPPDGPDRDQNDEFSGSSRPIATCDDTFAFTAPINVFRDTPHNNATQMHIWPDGTREEMMISLANMTELRGWYAVRGTSVALQWPVVAGRGDQVVINDHTVVDKDTRHSPLYPLSGNEAQFQQLVDENCIHFGKIVVSCGEIVAYKEYREMRRNAIYHQGRFQRWTEWREVAVDVPVYLLFVCMAYETAILRIMHPRGAELEELPLAKFLADYSLSVHLAPKMIQPPYSERRIVVDPLPMARSVFTVVKALLKFRRLHLKAQERKFAPGGAGFNAVLQSETAKSMKRPFQDMASA